LLGEAIGRLRRGEVSKEGGYDGEYGLIRLFRPGELGGATALFDVPAPATPPAREMDPAPRRPGRDQAGSPDGGPPDRLAPGPGPAAVKQEKGEPLLAG